MSGFTIPMKCNRELRPTRAMVTTQRSEWLQVTTSTGRVPLVDFISDLHRLLRVTSWVLRFRPGQRRLFADKFVSSTEKETALVLRPTTLFRVCVWRINFLFSFPIVMIPSEMFFKKIHGSTSFITYCSLLPQSLVLV